jgi:hypothetical protein
MTTAPALLPALLLVAPMAFAALPATPVAKDGACPSGYYSSGNYCLASSDSSRLALPKLGSCPSGYYSSGNYCISSR